MNFTKTIQLLSQQLAELQAVYLFGSTVNGGARHSSDIDLAVLGYRAYDPVALFELASKLAELLGKEVDLVDLNQASTIMKYECVYKGELLTPVSAFVQEFEANLLREKWDLDRHRASIIKQIKESGSVYKR